jgi:hypothetical protein
LGKPVTPVVRAWLHLAVHPTENTPENGQTPSRPGDQSGYQQARPQGQQGGFGFPAAPPVTMPDNPGAAPMDGPLRLVITLMFVNLGLSVVLTVLTLILHNSVVDFQLAHAHLPPNADPALVADTRKALQAAVWTRVVAVLVVSGLYIWRAFALRRGSRRAYLRLIWICVIGLLGIIYLIAAAQYPVWMRVEQVLQGLVLIALLYAVTRKEVRYRFVKPRMPS